MVKLRLARNGAKKRPCYRIVATDVRSPRDGRFIEQIGMYDPMSNPVGLQFKKERLDHWLSNGAQPSESVQRLILQFRKGEEAAATASN